MELEILKTLVILFGLSALVVFALHKLRVPSIVGFLIAGVFLGPHGFGFIQKVQEVELLAEIGVILLLFTVGLEISLKQLKRIHSAILGGGFSQVLLTLLTTTAIAYLFIDKLNASFFIGFLVALSSTAIVNGEVIPSPEPEFILKSGDVLYLIGKRENVLKAIEWLELVGD